MIPQGCNPQCPSCKHRSFTRSESLSQKQSWVYQALEPWTEQITPLQSASDSERWGYRRKYCLSAEWNGTQWEFGLYRKGPQYKKILVPLSQCPIHSPEGNHILSLLSQHLPGPPTLPLRYVLRSGELLTLVLRSNTPPSFPLDFLKPPDTSLQGCFWNLNPGAGNRVLNVHCWSLAWGIPRIHTPEGLYYGPGSFQQLLPKLHQQSLKEAAQFLSPTSNDRLIDLYCGNGSSLLHWTHHATPCIGIEISQEAIECAQHLPLPPSSQILQGRASDRIPQINAWIENNLSSDSQILLYANPPRTGFEPKVLPWLHQEVRPHRIAYLSCSLGTLSRNLSVLCNSGYAVKRITPYDFFPQTHHVECQALLERL